MHIRAPRSLGKMQILQRAKLPYLSLRRFLTLLRMRMDSVNGIGRVQRATATEMQCRPLNSAVGGRDERADIQRGPSVSQSSRLNDTTPSTSEASIEIARKV